MNNFVLILFIAIFIICFILYTCMCTHTTHESFNGTEGTEGTDEGTEDTEGTDEGTEGTEDTVVEQMFVKFKLKNDTKLLAICQGCTTTEECDYSLCLVDETDATDDQTTFVVDLTKDNLVFHKATNTTIHRCPDCVTGCSGIVCLHKDSPTGTDLTFHLVKDQELDEYILLSVSNDIGTDADNNGTGTQPTWTLKKCADCPERCTTQAVCTTRVTQSEQDMAAWLIFETILVVL